MLKGRYLWSMLSLLLAIGWSIDAVSRWLTLPTVTEMIPEEAHRPSNDLRLGSEHLQTLSSPNPSRPVHRQGESDLGLGQDEGHREDLIQNDDGPESDLRARGYEELFERSALVSTKVVEKALGDEDARVRRRVLSAAMLHHLLLPGDLLEHLVLNDRDPLVRRAALFAIGFHSQESSRAQWVAQRAISDPSPEVVSAAAELLEHLDAQQASPSSASRAPSENSSQLGESAVPMDPSGSAAP